MLPSSARSYGISSPRFADESQPSPQRDYLGSSRRLVGLEIGRDNVGCAQRATLVREIVLIASIPTPSCLPYPESTALGTQLGQHHDLAARLILLHAAMSFRDLVKVEGPAYLDA
jgi:hypothetical protein